MKHATIVLAAYLLFAIVYTSVVPPGDGAILLLVAVTGSTLGYLVRMVVEPYDPPDDYTE
jgi:hypothetical protein